MQAFTQKKEILINARQVFSLLRNYADGEFRNHWAKREVDMDHYLVETPCGTVGCFLGWAYNDVPEIQNRMTPYRETDLISKKLPEEYFTSHDTDQVDSLFWKIFSHEESGDPDEIIKRIIVAETRIMEILQSRLAV